MTDDLPHPVWSGTFKVFGVDLKCHVLSDGVRTIEADSVEQLLTAMANPETDSDDVDLAEFAKWQRGLGSKLWVL